MRTRNRCGWLRFAALLALSGCGADTTTACTLIGCNSGLTIIVSNAPTTSYSVVLTATGVQPVEVFCTQATPCVNGAFFTGVTARTAEVEVRLSDRTVRRSVAPTYQTSKPNGPNCEPTCTQGVAAVSL